MKNFLKTTRRYSTILLLFTSGPLTACSGSSDSLSPTGSQSITGLSTSTDVSALPCESGSEVTAETFAAEFPPFQKGQTWVYDVAYQVSDAGRSETRNASYLLKILDIPKEDSALKLDYLYTEDPELIGTPEQLAESKISPSVQTKTDRRKAIPKTSHQLLMDSQYNKYTRPDALLPQLSAIQYTQLPSGLPTLERKIYKVRSEAIQTGGKSQAAQVFCLKFVRNDVPLEVKQYLWTSPKIGLLRSLFSSPIEAFKVQADVRLRNFTPGSGPEYATRDRGPEYALYEVLPEASELETLPAQFDRGKEADLATCETGQPSTLEQVLQTYPQPKPGQKRSYAYVSFSYDSTIKGERASPGLIRYELRDTGSTSRLNLITEKIEKTYPTLPPSKTEDKQEVELEQLNAVMFDPNFSRPASSAKVYAHGTESIDYSGHRTSAAKYCIKSTLSMPFGPDIERTYIGWFVTGKGMVRSVAGLSGQLGTMTEHTMLRD